jgi:hypothetical protein
MRIARLRAATATALLSLSLAAPAFAHGARWDDDGHRRRYEVHRHDRSCDRDHHRHRGRDYYRGGHSAWRGDRHCDWNRGYWDGRRNDHRRRDHYDCRPCRRRWSDAHSFLGHLRHDHRVPDLAFPRVIVAIDGGWLFGG